MSVINTNYLSLVAQNNLGKSQSALGTAIERLSSGLRINSAKDDAAGQAIANRMTAQVNGLNQAQRNANDGISVAQTAEGALNQVNDNLQRIRELAVQAANGTNSSDDLQSVQEEITQRLEEINRISEQTNFNGVKVLSADDTIAIQVGAQDGEVININLKEITADKLGLGNFSVSNSLSVSDALSEVPDNATGTYDVTGLKVGQTLHEVLDGTGTGTGDYVVKEGNNFYAATYDNTASGAITIQTVEFTVGAETINENIRVASDGSNYVLFNGDAYAASLGVDPLDVTDNTVDFANGPITLADGTPTANPLAALDAALKDVDTLRSDLGAIQNRFESAITNLQTNSTNLQAARSRIEDADYAVEVANMSKNQILQQAGTSVLAQANQIPQGVLSLLR